MNENAKKPSGSGAGRALVAVYGILALAASARSAYQLATEFSVAPVAYLLSAVSAVVYLVATVALANVVLRAGTPRAATWGRVATAAIWFELVGVILVGVGSLAIPGVFRAASVWSWFGMGYGFVPLILPVLGLLWLRRAGRGARGVAS